MKKNLLSKNIHQWLFLLVCFVATLPSWAEEYTRDGIIYDINTSTNTATVKGFEDKSATSAEIRNRVAGCEVTSIGRSAFEYCSALVSINIPNSVTSIGEYAFYGCSALKVVLLQSDRIEFGSDVFRRNTNIYAIDNYLRIDLPSYNYQDQNVNNYIGGTWYTYGTPNIYDKNGSAISSDKWSGKKLEYSTGALAKTCVKHRCLLT